jgi:DNA helicase HerA-like ATPase
MTNELGIVIKGSLAHGLEMKLAEGRSVEDVRAGRFVVINGERFRYFSMITNVALSASNPQVLLNPPGPEDLLHRRVLAGTTTFGTVELRPMLMLPTDAPESYDEASLQPVKTIPPHFSPVAEANRNDVSRVFGNDGSSGFFVIGEPIDMDEIPVCLNLDRFVERSNAIFGKSGTGKTFLTRLCLSGIIKEKRAVNLVFDMHSEYGWSGTTEDRTRGSVRGLKQFFQSEVLVYSLDRASSERRGVPVENEVRIPFSQVTVEDIALLGRELNLNPTAVETGYLLVSRFRENWLREFLSLDGEQIAAFAEEIGAHAGALSALRRKLNVLTTDCSGFLKPSIADEDNAVKSILGALDSGKHVIVEFGQYSKPVQYMLVANILTRRIHAEYVRKTELAMAAGNRETLPLVITIEEAHKFLAPSLAGQTIFGTIAREMRKYNVTLLVVDQRPSGIDDEILSQVGTKLVCLLDDEKDMEAVLSGMPGAGGLRGVLASLDSKQQALILGHAVPMPIVVKTRTYDDEAFRKSMGYEDSESRRERVERNRDIDFP